VERYASLLLEVWREACRHIEIEESFARSAELLRHRLGFDAIWLRRIDLARGGLETVASVLARPEATPVAARSELPAHELERLLVWCRRGSVTHLPAGRLAEHVPGVVTPGLLGDVLAGPLLFEEGPVGVLALLARPPRTFRADQEPLLAALLEPFTVALENDRRVRELKTLREAAEADRLSLLARLGRKELAETIVGAEAGLRPVMERVERVVGLDVPVLILGETGSGKEVVARAIHARSKRAAGPFLRVNCGAIPAGLIDSELFGHERGSFTGAVTDRKGWFERANGGTLFLDEVGELPPDAQVRLLRVLQDGTLERVGGNRQIAVDVRIVAATHRDLHTMIAEHRFREDLWYRIAVFPIHLAPVRDRVEDIPALATHFALRAATRFGTPPLMPSPEDLDLLVRYPWPGNVREVAAVMERAVILGDGHRLEVARALGPLPPLRAASPTPPAPPGEPASKPGASTAPADAELRLDVAMRAHIEAALVRTHGRIEGEHGAATLLGINPHTLRARMRKLGIDWSRFRRPSRRGSR
jgi:transcriptional regulator with GAF, ATPase, and Fis domain